MDLTARIGSVTLPNPVMAASGCFGTGAELLGVVDASRLGAVVTKSLSAAPHAGNPAPRLVPTSGGGMLNAVGLQNPGVDHWVGNELPLLLGAGVRVVGSIWGRTVDEYTDAAGRIAPVAGDLVALEVNVSCPNLESPGDMFAHHPDQAAAVVRAVRARLDPLPVWVKLSPNQPSPVPVARAVVDAGADAVTLTNTLLGMVVDVARRRPHLGNGTGGLSGPPLRPVAVRCVHDVRAAFPSLPIVGVGGISRVEHALEHIMAGANAVQVGAAHFADPQSGVRIVRQLRRWCRRHRVRTLGDLVGAAQEAREVSR